MAAVSIGIWHSGTLANLVQPNIVIVMTDDQTLESVRVMSRTRAFFEARGAFFENFITGYSHCCPSRASFLTGQYAVHHGVLGNQAPVGGYARMDHSRTLPVWLQRAGYRTIHIGRYLNGYGYPDPSEVPPGWSDWQGLVTVPYFGFQLNDNGTVVRYANDPDFYQTDVLAQRAATAIDDAVEDGRPFLLSIAPYAVHMFADFAPVPAPRHEGAFADEALPRPPSFDEADVSDKPLSIRHAKRLDTASIDEATARYRLELETLLSVDELFDAVVQRLEVHGILDSTVVVFTSDNGFMNGEHRLPKEKAPPYEEAIRVPLMVAGPGFPGAGARIPTLAANIDLAPTMLRAAGGTADLALDGIALQDLLANPQQHANRTILLERFGPNKAYLPMGDACYLGLRSPRHTYVRHLATNEVELYDLELDPFQLTSRHDDEAYAQTLSELSLALDEMVPGLPPPCGLQVKARLGDVRVVESQEGIVTVRLPLTLNAPQTAGAGPLTFTYRVRPLGTPSAIAGQDFVQKAGKVTLDEGVTTGFITVQILPDEIDEHDEKLMVRIIRAPAGIEVEKDIGYVTIIDSEPSESIVLSLGTVHAVESDANGAGRESVYMPLTLSRSLPRSLTVEFWTSPGSASAVLDYLESSGSIEIPAGSVSANVPFDLRADMASEGSQPEVFAVRIRSNDDVMLLRPPPVGARGGIYIVDND
ncbi:MAG: sulfatase-like hydrolase/transferase [Sinimarinibacterium flocculans]|uniref:sulfatase-like hydrolase/transferase n=1 Tax=Sinimarinibacterium flocculans TaxID=985250 RepID=UPI003C3DAAF5